MQLVQLSRDPLVFVHHRLLELLAALLILEPVLGEGPDDLLDLPVVMHVGFLALLCDGISSGLQTGLEVGQLAVYRCGRVHNLLVELRGYRLPVLLCRLMLLFLRNLLCV